MGCLSLDELAHAPQLGAFLDYTVVGRVVGLLSSKKKRGSFSSEVPEAQVQAEAQARRVLELERVRGDYYSALSDLDRALVRAGDVLLAAGKSAASVQDPSYGKKVDALRSDLNGAAWTVQDMSPSTWTVDGIAAGTSRIKQATSVVEAIAKHGGGVKTAADEQAVRERAQGPSHQSVDQALADLQSTLNRARARAQGESWKGGLMGCLSLDELARAPQLSGLGENPSWLKFLAPWTTVTEYQAGQVTAAQQKITGQIELQKAGEQQELNRIARYNQARGDYDATLGKIRDTVGKIDDLDSQIRRAFQSTPGLDPAVIGQLNQYHQAELQAVQSAASTPLSSVDPIAVEAAVADLARGQLVLDTLYSQVKNLLGIVQGGVSAIAQQAQAQAAAQRRAQVDQERQRLADQLQSLQQGAVFQQQRTRQLQELQAQIAVEQDALAKDQATLARLQGGR